MRIIEEPKKFSNFEDLKLGDVFNYDGVWYMKIDTIKSEMSVLMRLSQKLECWSISRRTVILNIKTQNLEFMIFKYS